MRLLGGYEYPKSIRFNGNGRTITFLTDSIGGQGMDSQKIVPALSYVYIDDGGEIRAANNIMALSFEGLEVNCE